MWLDKRSISKISSTAVVLGDKNLRSQERGVQSWWDISVSKSNVKNSRTLEIEEEDWREAKPNTSEKSEEDVCSR